MSALSYVSETLDLRDQELLLIRELFVCRVGVSQVPR
jgi:hypothetical protein